MVTLPEANIAHENPIFPCKYHQNGGFSMAMLVSGRVVVRFRPLRPWGLLWDFVPSMVFRFGLIQVLG